MNFKSIFYFTGLVFQGRTVFFTQARGGYKNKKIKIYKFRTMNIGKDKYNKSVTFYGKFLRKFKIDELPQFYNILKGDLSIVGPRPLPEKIEKKINKHLRKKRRTILPGITGTSQINFTGKYRTLREKINLDIELVNNYNLNNYFKVILNTPLILIIKFFKNKSSIVK